MAPNRHDSAARRQLALEAQRLERRGWTFNTHTISGIVEAIDNRDNTLFLELLTAGRTGDSDAGIVAIYAVLPRLIEAVAKGAAGHCRARALDEALGHAWIVLHDQSRPLPAAHAICLFIDRVRVRSRRSSSRHRPDRLGIEQREVCADPTTIETHLRADGGDDPTVDAVLRRAEVIQVGGIIRTALDERAISQADWEALVDHRILGHPINGTECRGRTALKSAVSRTSRKVRALAMNPHESHAS
jgi:hypothetical protein